MRPRASPFSLFARARGRGEGLALHNTEGYREGGADGYGVPFVSKLPTHRCLAQGSMFNKAVDI